MGFVKEFKAFAMKGNVLDLAVGVVIGAAFGAIVSSIVDNIIMPLVGILTGGINFDGLILKVGDAQLKYGLAISAIVKFIIIALFLFLVIKAVNRKKVEPPVVTVPELSQTEKLLTEIRDLLKK